MSVRSWPTYLLRDIPEATRTALEEDAEREERSLIEIIREILCSHYGLDCEPVTAAGRSKFTDGTNTMLLRLQPELWEAIRRDIAAEDILYGAPHKIIHGILSAYYNGGHPHD